MRWTCTVGCRRMQMKGAFAELFVEIDRQFHSRQLTFPLDFEFYLIFMIQWHGWHLIVLKLWKLEFNSSEDEQMWRKRWNWMFVPTCNSSLLKRSINLQAWRVNSEFSLVTTQKVIDHVEHSTCSMFWRQKFSDFEWAIVSLELLQTYNQLTLWDIRQPTQLSKFFRNVSHTDLPPLSLTFQVIPLYDPPHWLLPALIFLIIIHSRVASRWG